MADIELDNLGEDDQYEDAREQAEKKRTPLLPKTQITLSMKHTDSD